MEGNYSDVRIPCKICGRSFAAEVLTKHQNICKKSTTASAKRKPFDSSKQRVLEGELSLKQIKQAQKKIRKLLRMKTAGSYCSGLVRAVISLSRGKKARRALESSKSVVSEPVYRREDFPVDCSACGDVLEMRKKLRLDLRPPKTHWREKHQDFLNAVRNARGVQRAIDSGGPLPPPPPPSINPDYIQCPYCSRRFSQQAADRHISFCKEQQSRLPRGKPSPNATAKQNARLNYQVPKPKAKTNSPAASPASVSVARSGARPSPMATRSPAGGATRGRGTIAPETEESTLTDTDLFTITINETGEETSAVECETVSALPFPAWQSPLMVGSYTPPTKIPRMIWPSTFSVQDSLSSKTPDDSLVPLGTLELRRKTLGTENTLPSLKEMLKNYLGPRRCHVSVMSSRAGGNKATISAVKGRQQQPQPLDPSLDFPLPHRQQHHHRYPQQHQQQFQGHQDELVSYKPIRHDIYSNMTGCNQPPIEKFFNTSEEFFIPFDNARDYPARRMGSPHDASGEKSRKLEPSKLKANSLPQSHHQNKFNPVSEDDGIFEETTPSPKPRTPSAVAFCHECGAKYPMTSAKFCCECGMKKAEVQSSSGKSRRHSKGYTHVH